MADDTEVDLIPMKDVRGPQKPQCVAYTDYSEGYGFDRPTVLEKKVAEQLSRNDLEDQLYQLKEQNAELKKNSRKQEEQIKKLLTKMSRLLNERKKGDLILSPGRKRDLEMEETLEELNDKIRNLEKNNVQLKERLLVAKQQVFSQNRRPNPYNHVSPKVNSNRPRSGVGPYISATNQRVQNPSINQRGTTPSTLPPYVLKLLDEARTELFNLRDVVSSQRGEIDIYEQEVEIYKERLKMKDTEFGEEIVHLKSQITEGQRQHVQENLDLIRLHRELKQKNSKIVALQAQITDMEEKSRTQRAQNDRLLKEIDDKTVQNRDEQKKSLDLFSELQKNKAALHNFAELQDGFKSLKKENDVLKDTNDKLIKSVLSQERERSSQSTEQVLKEKISQLESSLNAEVKEKEALLAEMKIQKDRNQELKEKHEKLEGNFSETKQYNEEMESKLNILNDQEVDFEELGEALALIKLKKQRSINIKFLESLPGEDDEDWRSKLKKSEKDHAETIRELCNVREMLMTQYKINKESEDELKALTEKHDQCKKEFQVKLEEYASLLDIRSVKIQKLERQLNDVAYGTKKIRIEEFQQETDAIETLELDRGENLLEIHIIKFVYSEDGVKFLKTSNPSSFLTWNFYEFELQSTPVMQGVNAQFSCSAQYRVKIDDFFLFYLHKNTTTLELHQSLGADYRTLAACQLNFSELLEQSHGRLHGTQHLIGACDDTSGTVFGTVHFWVKLHVPMEEAFKLYKQKFKALRYIQGNHTSSNVAVKLLEQPLQRESSMNDLHVKITRCQGLKGRTDNVQPSAFCVYKLYNHPDNDTIIVPYSNNPEFFDHQTLSVCMDEDLEKYLKTQNMQVYVFDDNDPDITSYIGRASISLLPLAHNKNVNGIFELTKGDDGESYGSIELSLYWQHAYQAPPMIDVLLSQLDEPIEYPPHIAPVTPILIDEDLINSSDNELTRGSFLSKLKRKTRPLRTSTPIKAPSDSSAESSPSVHKKDISKDVEPVNSAASLADFAESLRTSPKHTKSPDSTIEHVTPYETLLKSPVLDSAMKSMMSREEKELFKEALEKALAKRNDDDTVSEKRQEMSFEEISDEDKQALSDSESSVHSEQRAKANSSSSSNVTESNTMPSIVIGIHRLSLEPGSSALDDSSIQLLYVEFKFLDYPLEELETPSSVPKPVPPDFVTFKYKKAFPFHPEANVDKFKLLMQMFNPDAPEASWIKFTVVSEPPDDDDGRECEDVGYAYVDLRQIMNLGMDMIEEDIDVFSAKELETKIGQLTVTVQALRVLRFLECR